MKQSSILSKTMLAALSLVIAGGVMGQSALAADKGPDLKTDAVKSVAKLKYPIGNLIDAPRFQGDVYSKNFIPRDNEGKLSVTNLISFAPGAHSAWHRHGAMTIINVEGIGLYQEEGKKVQVLHPGEKLYIPAGTLHWHGAAPTSAFSQFVIYDAEWKNTFPAMDLRFADYNTLEYEY